MTAKNYKPGKYLGTEGDEVSSTLYANIQEDSLTISAKATTLFLLATQYFRARFFCRLVIAISTRLESFLLKPATDGKAQTFQYPDKQETDDWATTRRKQNSDT